MFDVQGPSAMLIVASMIFAVADLTFGALIGWWLRGRRPTAALQNDIELQRARNALNRLQDLTISMAANVGEHNTRVQEINQELQSHQENSDEDLDPAVVSTLAKIVEANHRLQKQLTSAETKLQQQAKEIEDRAADALTDSLTGLANRRAFDAELAKRLAEFHRNEVPFSLIMIDIDFFKKFNDTHGHLAGDRVLCGVGRVLQDAADNEDLVARYGGEEFALIIPTGTLDSAQRTTERVRAAVETEQFLFEGTRLKVTASQGLAQITAGETAAELIKRADMALYAAKKAGRNRGYLHNGEANRPIRLEVPAPTTIETAPPIVSQIIEKSLIGTPPSDARLDATTGLANRTAFCHDVRRRVAEAKRHSGALSLMLVSLNNFNELVGKEGGQAADLALKTLTQFLSAATREMDTVGRYGQNLFGIMLPGTALDQARIIAERLRKATDEFMLKTPGGKSPVSVSVGLAGLEPSDDTASLLQRAEAELADALDGGGRTYESRGRAAEATETKV